MGMVIPEVGVVAEAMAGLEYLAQWEVGVVAEAMADLEYLAQWEVEVVAEAMAGRLEFRLMHVFWGAIALYTAVLCWGVEKYIAVLLESS